MTVKSIGEDRMGKAGYTPAMPLPKNAYDDLYELFRSIRTKKEAMALLQDILTPRERAALALRWQEIQMLAAGLPQREIGQRLGISITKITRGSRVLQEGTGGFAHFLKKLKKVPRTSGTRKG